MSNDVYINIVRMDVDSGDPLLLLFFDSARRRMLLKTAPDPWVLDAPCLELCSCSNSDIFVSTEGWCGHGRLLER